MRSMSIFGAPQGLNDTRRGRLSRGARRRLDQRPGATRQWRDDLICFNEPRPTQFKMETMVELGEVRACRMAAAATEQVRSEKA
jgi:hypothetical protein